MRQLRGDPRFQSFIEELGMVSYYERRGTPNGHELRGGRLVCA
jgi:hypothetical protein